MLNYKGTKMNKKGGILTNFLVLCLFLVCVFQCSVCFCESAPQDVVEAFPEPISGYEYYLEIVFDDQYTEIQDNVPDGWTHLSSVWLWGVPYSDSNAIRIEVKFESISGGQTIYNSSVILPIYELNAIYPNYELTISYNGASYTNNTDSDSGNPVIANAENLAFVYVDDTPWYIVTFEATFVKKVMINYKDKGGADFSGTHATGYSTKHTVGEETTLDTPTKSGYTFGGWFLNDPNCNESARVESLSASEDYDEITLYAKWIPNISHLTFNCANFSVDAPPSYMVYVYYNDNLVCQLVPSAQTTTIDIFNTASTDTYTLLFVFGYYGELSVTAQDGITITNRKIVISDLSDKTINYAIYTPRINSSVII